MFNQVKLILSILLAFVFGVVTSNANDNLVTNGGFETGDFSGWQLYDPPQTGSILVLGVVHSGSYSVGFGSNNGVPDSIQQTIATIPGQYYDVSFWLKNSSVGGDSFQALWNDNPMLNLIPTTTSFDYTKYSYLLAATDTSAVLKFMGTDAPSYIYLDDINVIDTNGTPVPEPTPFLLLGTALAGFGWFRRRKN